VGGGVIQYKPLRFEKGKGGGVHDLFLHPASKVAPPLAAERSANQWSNEIIDKEIKRVAKSN